MRMPLSPSHKRTLLFRTVLWPLRLLMPSLPRFWLPRLGRRLFLRPNYCLLFPMSRPTLLRRLLTPSPKRPR